MPRAGGSLLIDLVVGGILIAAAPSYTRGAIAGIRDNPGGSFLWDLGIGVGSVIAPVLPVIIIIGLLVVIPGFLAFVLLSTVGGAVSTVFLGALIPTFSSIILFTADMLGLGVVGHNLTRSWV